MKQIIREAVVEEVLTKVVTKPALYATECGSCGRLFQMAPYCNDSIQPGLLTGTFDSSPSGKSNQLIERVCSMECATNIVNNWHQLPKYMEYEEIDATLVRIVFGLTALVKYEEQLIDEWNSTNHENTNSIGHT